MDDMKITSDTCTYIEEYYKTYVYKRAHRDRKHPHLSNMQICKVKEDRHSCTDQDG